MMNAKKPLTIGDSVALYGYQRQRGRKSVILFVNHWYRKFVSGSHQSVTTSVSSSGATSSWSSTAPFFLLSFFASLLSPGRLFFPLFHLKIPRRQARLTRPILRCMLKVTQLALKSCASDFHRLPAYICLERGGPGVVKRRKRVLCGRQAVTGRYACTSTR